MLDVVGAGVGDTCVGVTVGVSVGVPIGGCVGVCEKSDVGVSRRVGDGYKTSICDSVGD